jgi:hypothetical protein
VRRREESRGEDEGQKGSHVRAPTYQNGERVSLTPRNFFA